MPLRQVAARCVHALLALRVGLFSASITAFEVLRQTRSYKPKPVARLALQMGDAALLAVVRSDAVLGALVGYSWEVALPRAATDLQQLQLLPDGVTGEGVQVTAALVTAATPALGGDLSLSWPQYGPEVHVRVKEEEARGLKRQVDLCCSHTLLQQQCLPLTRSSSTSPILLHRMLRFRSAPAQQRWRLPWSSFRRWRASK